MMRTMRQGRMLLKCRTALMRGREEANVKKKLIIVFAVITAVLLLIPVRKVYEDGGTQTYTWNGW